VVPMEQQGSVPGQALANQNGRAGPARLTVSCGLEE
jgi:hypothetical protein